MTIYDDNNARDSEDRMLIH